MPPTTNVQSPDGQPMAYPHTSPLTAHRPTRPTAVVPPLPKDPTNSSPMGSMNTPSSMMPPAANHYQHVSPQKSSTRDSNPQKQVAEALFNLTVNDEISLSAHVRLRRPFFLFFSYSFEYARPLDDRIRFCFFRLVRDTPFT
jgi:hypothetical protein